MVDAKIIDTYKEFLKSLPMLKKGISRIHNVITWPDAKLSKDTEDTFLYICEYISFVVGVKQPFFRILYNILSSKIASLFNNLKPSSFKSNKKLTYDEAYDLFVYLGKNDDRDIINIYNKLDSNVYTNVIKALDHKDKGAFIEALRDVDCSDLMTYLWYLRYILLGITDRTTKNPLTNQWLNEESYEHYFVNITDSLEEQYIRKLIIEIARIEKRKRHIQRGIIPISVEEILGVGTFKHYSKDIFEKWSFLNDPKISKDYIDKLFDERHTLANSCEDLTSKIIVMALRSNKHKIETELERLPQPHKKEKGETYNVVGKIDAFSLEKQCKNFGKSKRLLEQIKSDNMSFSEGIEKVWEIEMYDFVDNNLSVFSDYILLYLIEINRILKIVEPILNDNEKQLLIWLFERANYAIPSIIMNDYESEDSPSQDNFHHKITNIDNNEDHSEWFNKVRSSKVDVPIDGNFNETLFTCLSKLHKNMVDNAYIDPSTDKNLFIYRFSGFNGPFPPEKKIYWNGKNTLLGYIVRCLVSDQKYAPEKLSSTASFFQSKTGKVINLASAENYEVKDFENDKERLPRDFVKAVELLKECGFIKVEFTSKRR